MLGNERKVFEAVKRHAIHSYGDRCACCGDQSIEFLRIGRVDDPCSFECPSNEDIIGSTSVDDVTSKGVDCHEELSIKGDPAGHIVLCTKCLMARAIYGYCPRFIHGDPR